jgi:glycosyltransferase involved in cell wall biosynthesis
VRIAVDARHLTAGRGVARYTARLLEAMVAAFPGDDWRLFVPGREPVQAPVPPVRHPLPSRALFGAAALAGRPRVDRLAGGADVVWAPAPAPLAVSRDVPLVLTVHDLSWVERPSDFTPYERLWHRLARVREQARRAAAVIAVSETTKQAIVRAWGVDQVAVVRSGPGMVAQPAGGSAPARPYFLAVGALEPRKAPDLLARAFATARRRGLEADLVFAGDGRLAGAVRGPDVRVTGWLPDEELAELYANAVALVQAARLEGFGLPPLEAAAHGTPAIIADLPVYSETLGEAALRVPPGDEDALADALLRLASDAGLRGRLAAEAAEAVAGLSWERAARETHAILREAAG